MHHPPVESTLLALSNKPKFTKFEVRLCCQITIQTLLLENLGKILKPRRAHMSATHSPSPMPSRAARRPEPPFPPRGSRAPAVLRLNTAKGR